MDLIVECEEYVFEFVVEIESFDGFDFYFYYFVVESIGGSEIEVWVV